MLASQKLMGIIPLTQIYWSKPCLFCPWAAWRWNYSEKKHVGGLAREVWRNLFHLCALGRKWGKIRETALRYLSGNTLQNIALKIPTVPCPSTESLSVWMFRLLWPGRKRVWLSLADQPCEILPRCCLLDKCRCAVCSLNRWHSQCSSFITTPSAISFNFREFSPGLKVLSQSMKRMGYLTHACQLPSLSSTVCLCLCHLPSQRSRGTLLK